MYLNANLVAVAVAMPSTMTGGENALTVQENLKLLKELGGRGGLALQSVGRLGFEWIFEDQQARPPSFQADFLIAIGSDEKLLRRLNEFNENATISTGGKGTDAKWKLDPTHAVSVSSCHQDSLYPLTVSDLQA
ncbi:hypothetical protein BDQ12DRAFT_670333 [Crucibulum laeve]|uniref:Uncharacterized protein n=1 Tax=Crucibulum laeve TaxID=68775 RepID=A0A5C3LL72_9AGAR|nr:hypothetical protein BDQ12DRAFT_670333 [Crucibulum laeve]